MKFLLITFTLDRGYRCKYCRKLIKIRVIKNTSRVYLRNPGTDFIVHAFEFEIPFLELLSVSPRVRIGLFPLRPRSISSTTRIPGSTIRSRQLRFPIAWLIFSVINLIKILKILSRNLTLLLPFNGKRSIEFFKSQFIS